MHVLDSTDPAQVKAVEGKVISRRRCSSFPSKSGQHHRTEHLQTIFLRPRKERGWRQASEHFCAITDPGSKMARRWLREIASATSSSAIPPLAGDTPRSLISAWFQRLLWE